MGFLNRAHLPITYPLDVPFSSVQFKAVGKYQINYHVACQIQKMILGKMGLEFGAQNQSPRVGKTRTDLSVAELSSLTKSWELLEERKRILRMKGLPKPVESKEREKKPTRAVFTE